MRIIGEADNGLIKSEKIKDIILCVCEKDGKPLENLVVGDFYLTTILTLSYSNKGVANEYIYTDLSQLSEFELNHRLNEEIEERKEADTTLQENIESEAERVDLLILNLQENIDLAIAQIYADIAEHVKTLTEALDEEASTREENDNNLENSFNQKLYQEVQRVNSLVEEINEKIAEEVSNLNDTITEAVTALNTAIETEQTKRRTADEKLLETLTQEVEDRKTADTILENTLKNDINTAVTDEREYVDQNILELKNKAGTSLSLTMDSNYVVSAVLTSIDGTELSRETIDLPLEEFVVGGSYDEETKEVVLTLKNGDIIRFSIVDLVDGLVNEKDFDETISKLTTEFKEDIDSLTTTLTTETEERKAADETLTQNLNSEITNRENADSELETKITEEAQTRADADTNLGNAIDLESVARDQGDKELNLIIEDLETKLSGADEELKTLIENEVSRALNAEGLLETNLSNEATLRELADTSLEQLIYTETANRELADTQIREDFEKEIREYLGTLFDLVGDVDTFADLPETGVEKGTAYYVRDEQEVYFWNGTDWIGLGQIFDLSAYATLEDLEDTRDELVKTIDEAIASSEAKTEAKINGVEEEITITYELIED